jgi:hypothetical protein
MFVLDVRCVQQYCTLVVMAERDASSGTAQRSRLQALPGRLLLAGGSIVVLGVALLATELGLRSCCPDYLTKTRGPHVFSDAFGWAGRKGTVVAMGESRVSLNEHGYRGRALGLPRRHDLTRVVVLGDSVAFGLGVSDEQTFCSLLDARANGIEVANLAVQGYGPDQELLTLERDGLQLAPDVVVLAHCLANDFAEAMLPVSLYDGHTPKPRFTLEGGRLELDGSSLAQAAGDRAVQRLSDHSHLYNRLVALLPQGHPDGRHWRERQADALRDDGLALRLNLALVRRMNERCRERGITLLVTLFPDRFSYRTKPALAEAFMAELRADGIPLMDLAATFRGRGLRLTDVALDGTGHLSAVGHGLVSVELEREIVRRRPRSGAARATKSRSALRPLA